MILVDDVKNPSLYLIGCHPRQDYLQVELGFISMGRLNRPYQLFDTQNNLICTVILPTAAIMLPIDVTCLLTDEKFFYDQ